MSAKTLTVVVVCPEGNLAEVKRWAEIFSKETCGLGARQITERDSTLSEESWLEPAPEGYG